MEEIQYIMLLPHNNTNEDALYCKSCRFEYQYQIMYCIYVTLEEDC